MQNTHPNYRLFLFSVICSLWILLTCKTSFAEEPFPNKPIKMIVPLAPGGATDTVTRIVAKQVSQILNNPIVVENRIGAGD